MTDHEKIPDAIKSKFPKTGVNLGTLNTAHADALGLEQAPIVRLSVGGRRFGISHNWKHHKEMFTNLADSQKVLEETIGNSNARCVLSISRDSRGRISRLAVFHSPQSGAYCVLRLSNDCQSAEIVSWHKAGDEYGNRQWSKN